MKAIQRAFALWIVLILTVSMLPVNAHTALNFNGTVGEKAYWVFFQDTDDIVESAEIANGGVPGLGLLISRDCTVVLQGTPTRAGSYVVYVAVETQRSGRYELTVYVNISEPTPTPTPTVKPTAPIDRPSAVTPTPKPAANGTPVITKNPTNESVVEGDSATFIARADHTKQYVWEIAIADASIDCADLPAYLGKGVKVSGCNSNTLVISNIPKELNGAHVWCRFVGSEKSVDSKSAVITVTAKKDATPVITKHPTDETVDEGGEAVFVAKAKYAQSYSWQLVSPNGTTYDCKDAPKTFPGLKVSGADTERIVLSNLPAELDGYSILCRFTAGKTVSSNKAKLTVIQTATPTPPVSPSEQPSPEPSAAPTPTPTSSVTATSTPPPSDPANNAADASGNNTLLIVLVIAVAAVAIAAIACFTLLKMKKLEEDEDEGEDEESV